MNKNTPAQDSLQLATPDGGTTTVEKYEFEPIKGYPMLNWRGKRPFTSTQYYPAQLKEVHGEEVDGWRNKIFWGDNLQVMSHLLKEFRGKVDLIYIDPPFDSKADYKKSIRIKGVNAESEHSIFEEKQYTDIWSNDEYLQFLFERICLLRELLTKNGSIFLHCDPKKSHHIKCILDEIFGQDNFRAEICWKKATKTTSFNNYGSEHDAILFYSKSSEFTFNQQFRELADEQIERNYKYVETPTGEILTLSADQRRGIAPLPTGRRFRTIPITNMNPDRNNLRYEFLGVVKTWAKSKAQLELDLQNNLIIQWNPGQVPVKKQYLDENKGVKINDLWTDISNIQGGAIENTEYPTQKPEKLLERIIQGGTNEGDLIFDCFSGSGTTLAVATKLGRRFIGADINLGAIQTTSKRLLGLAETLRQLPIKSEGHQLTGFEFYNVNNYELFRNPAQAKELLIEALEIQKLEFSTVFDGEKDGRMVKIMPVNRIATRADLNELIAGFDYKAWERKQHENPNRPVEKITLVCMGHEPTLRAELELAAKPFKIDVEVVDILRDKADLEFKRDSQAKVSIKKGELVIEKFYPMNLLQKLSLQKEAVEDWKELAESVLIDWNYDGAVLQPAVVDIPGKNEMVKGTYKVPDDAGTIRVKITDLLSESWEGSVCNGD